MRPKTTLEVRSGAKNGRKMTIRGDFGVDLAAFSSLHRVCRSWKGTGGLNRPWSTRITQWFELRGLILKSARAHISGAFLELRFPLARRRRDEKECPKRSFLIGKSVLDFFRGYNYSHSGWRRSVNHMPYINGSVLGAKWALRSEPWLKIDFFQLFSISSQRCQGLTCIIF